MNRSIEYIAEGIIKGTLVDYSLITKDNVNTLDYLGNSLLYYSIIHNRTKITKHILTFNPLINKCDMYNRYPIHNMLFTNDVENIDAMCVLLGDNINIAAPDGRTIPHIILKDNIQEQVDWLFNNHSKYNFNWNILDECKFTPLHYWLSTYSINTHFITDLYLIKNIKLEQQVKNNLFQFILSFSHDKDLNNIKELYKWLNPEINHKFDNGYTMLHHVCKTPNHNYEIVRWLILSGSDINNQANDGDAPLHLGCKIGDIDIVKILIIQRGIKINLTNNYLLTPLDIARNYCYLDILQVLLKCSKIIVKRVEIIDSTVRLIV